jgi:hypothetical protein
MQPIDLPSGWTSPWIAPRETGEECVGVAGIDYEPAGDGEYPDGMPY